jgi:hypothetical protein
VRRPWAVLAVELDLLALGVAEAVLLIALALEAREASATFEEVLVGPFKILQGMLLRVDRRILQPRRFGAVAPARQPLRHTNIPDELPAILAILLLRGERIVIDATALTAELVHLAHLLTGWHQFEREGLESLHVGIISALMRCQGRLRRPRYPSSP